MSELIVIGFKNSRERAASVLHDLRARDEAWTTDLERAVVLYRNAEGELTVNESYESTKGGGAIGGSLFGTLIGFGLAALTLPLTAGASAPLIAGALVAGAVGGTIVGARRGMVDSSWWKDELRAPEGFLTQIESTVQQCDSAIAVLRRQRGPEDLAERFRRYDGTVLITRSIASA